MKESVLRDLVSSHIVKLVTGGTMGVYPDPFAARHLKPEGSFSIQSPIVLSQLACSPGAQILSFLVMETDSMVRVGRRLFPEIAREESLKLVVSANAEILNFATSRLSWLLAKLEGIRNAEVSPPKIGNFGAGHVQRIRSDEGAFVEFNCAPRNLAFKFIACVQCVT